VKKKWHRKGSHRRRRRRRSRKKKKRKKKKKKKEKKKQEKHFGRLSTFWFGTFAMYFSRYNTLLFIFKCFHDEQHAQWH